MKHVLPLVLVLWGHHCDEITAVTAVVQNRRAGRRAQLVGLDNRNRRGANGVQLVTDLTLSEALAQASAVHSINCNCSCVTLWSFLALSINAVVVRICWSSEARFFSRSLRDWENAE